MMPPWGRPRAAAGPFDAAEPRHDGGMVTAELAVVIPVVVLFLALGLGLVRYGIDQIRCIDAARVAARAAARGDTPSAVLEVGRRGAPPGAQVTVAQEGRLVRVTVLASPAGARLLPLPDLRAVAVADMEGVDAP